MPLCLWLLIGVFLSFSCSHEIGIKSNVTWNIAHLIPDDIPGWKKVGPLWEAKNQEELYSHINGGATIFIKYGFQSSAGQIYHNPEGIEVEVSLYALEAKEKAKQLFNDPLLKPPQSKKLENLGEDARVDESGLFWYTVEFIQGPFFVRVIVQDKSKHFWQIANQFSHHILQKINREYIPRGR